MFPFRYYDWSFCSDSTVARFSSSEDSIRVIRFEAAWMQTLALQHLVSTCVGGGCGFSMILAELGNKDQTR